MSWSPERFLRNQKGCSNERRFFCYLPKLILGRGYSHSAYSSNNRDPSPQHNGIIIDDQNAIVLSSFNTPMFSTSGTDILIQSDNLYILAKRPTSQHFDRIRAVINNYDNIVACKWFQAIQQVAQSGGPFACGDDGTKHLKPSRDFFNLDKTELAHNIITQMVAEIGFKSALNGALYKSVLRMPHNIAFAYGSCL